MNILGWNINKKKIEANQNNMNNTLEELYGSFRIKEDPYKVRGEDAIVRNDPLPTRTMYYLADYSDLLQTIRGVLGRELFRNGHEIEEKFALKCAHCKKEFRNPTEECDKCGSTEFNAPDSSQKKTLEEKIKEMNGNHQSLKAVCKMFNDDCEVVDDGYVQALQSYAWSEGKLMGNKVLEFLRIHPMHIKICADETGRLGRNRNGDKINFCLVHRDSIHINKEKCDHCGREMFSACYKGMAAKGKEIYYADFEIFHTSKYHKSMTYGFSNVVVAYMKVNTLMAGDKYIMDYYVKQRSPKGMLFIKMALDPLRKAWKAMKDIFSDNPHQIPPMSVETGPDKGGKFVEFIDFMRTLDEMQWTTQRQEFRNVVGGLYGVMPIFQADVSTGGGLNNEGTQVPITSRAMEDGQGIFNDELFPWMLERLGITDYMMILKPPEEKDEAAEHDLFNKKAMNAALMQQMGYEVTLNHDNEFEFGPMEEPVEPAQGIPGETPSIGEGLETEGGGQRFDGDMESMRLSKKKVAKDTVTSTTPGFHNPRYSDDKRVREDLGYLATKSLDNIMKQTGCAVDVKKANNEKGIMINDVMRSIYGSKFNGMSKATSDQMKKQIVRMMKKGSSTKDITEYLKRKAGRVGTAITSARASIIANDQAGQINRGIRKWAYKQTDPSGTELYKWVGPVDFRRTEICKRITASTSNGVTMKELESIIAKEGDPKTTHGWNPHIGCRHTAIRKVR